MRSFAIQALRRVTPRSRDNRPKCSCVQVVGSKLYAWTGCESCRGTGGAGAPEGAKASGRCASSSMEK